MPLLRSLVGNTSAETTTMATARIVWNTISTPSKPIIKRALVCWIST